MFVKKKGAVIRTYYYIVLGCLSQTSYIIAAKKVGMLGVATEHQNLMSVVTTNATAFGAIPEKTFRVLYHLRHMLG